MNIVKAIEIKEVYHERYKNGMLSWEREADELSIEALKRVNGDRLADSNPYYLPLIGETV